MKDLTTTYLRRKEMHNVKNARLLKDAIQYGKVHFVTWARRENGVSAEIDRKTNEEVEKVIQHIHATADEVKGEMTGRAMGRHLINLYSNRGT